MHEVNFIDKSFDHSLAGKYSISIQANSNGLAYCICDDEINTYVLFRKHRFEKVVLPGDLIREITGVLKDDEYLNLKYHRVRYLGYTQQTTLVPEQCYDSTKMRDYLSFNHAGDIDQELFSNKIDTPGIRNVFALTRELVELITQHYNKVEFFNQTTPFIRNIAGRPESLTQPVVYVGLNPDFFDIACTGSGKLRLYNTFLYASENDLLYYIIFIYNTAGFDLREIPLVLSGEFSSKLSYYEMLKQYLPKIAYDDTACIPALSSGLKQMNVTRFLNLLNLKSCVSSVEHMGVEK